MGNGIDGAVNAALEIKAALKERDSLRAQRDELRGALEAMSGAFDTPIARRRYSTSFADEARQIARVALANTKED